MSMYKWLVAFLVLLVTQEALARGPVIVRGYVRKDGTYVAPHYRSSPDGNFNNNWSTDGNFNPYTGEDGKLSQPPARSGLGIPSAPVRGGYAPLFTTPPNARLPATVLPIVEPDFSLTPSLSPPTTATPASATLGLPTPKAPPQPVEIQSPAVNRPLTYLESQKVRDTERAQFWQTRGYSFNPAYMSAYTMDQKVKDIERAIYWKSQGYSFSADYMSAYAMDQKVKDIERARFWQSKGYQFSPEYMSAYAMDQKVKDIDRAKYWGAQGLNFNPEYMSAYATDREAERLLGQSKK